MPVPLCIHIPVIRMNQKNLIMIIVAMVAVFVIALWLAGVTGSGPLAGCTNCAPAPQPTALTLGVSVYNPDTGDNGRQISFQGTLLTSGGAPVPSRNVTITSGGSTVSTVTTDPRGTFQAIYSEYGGSHSYIANFAGEERYLASQSSTVSSP